MRVPTVPPSPKLRRPRARMLLTALAVSATAAALTMAPTQASAAHARLWAASRPAVTVSGDPRALASDIARRTGHPVTVGQLTTPDSLTQAMPDGLFKLTTSSGPVRTRTRHGWQALDPALRPGPGGTWSPAVSFTPVTVSGGGTGPLAVLSSGKGMLAVYWPGRLPRPAVTGGTATYRSVLPGVDLQVTVSAQGGFRDALIIRDRAAATALAARHLAMTTVTTSGLRVAPGQNGTLQATAGTGGPAFTATVPVTWDSATTAPFPARSKAAAYPRGMTVGMPWAPAVSTVSQPGRRAHVAWARATVSVPRTRDGITRQTVTVVPGSVLTSAAAVYPAVTIPPGWYASGGSTQWYVSDASAYNTTNYYQCCNHTADPSAYDQYDGSTPGRQVGYSAQTGLTHTFARMDLHPSQLADSQVYYSSIQFILEHSYDFSNGSCSVPVVLKLTGGPQTVSGQPTISYDHEPNWDQQLAGPVSAGDSSTCTGTTTDEPVAFDISTFMKSWGPAGATTATFGMQATDASTTNGGWLEFDGDSSSVTMTTWYAHQPSSQRSSFTSPGGACQSVSPARTLIGNDDVTLNTTTDDPDPGSLTTKFVVASTAAPGTNLLNTPTVSTTPGLNFPLTISRNTIQNWITANNGVNTFEWYAITTDQAGLTNSGSTAAGSPAKPCLFTYDPSAPSAPDIQFPAGSGPLGALGTNATLTFARCSGALANPQASCTGTAPATYVYQVNAGPPVSVPVTGLTQTVSLPLTRVGTNTITLIGVSAAGNPSPPYPAPTFQVNPPATAYADADYTDSTGHPDLITVGNGTGSGTPTGLWLSPSDGAGHLSTPVDIGVQGTQASATPGGWTAALGPNQVQVLHGDFTGNKVQDIAAYFPATGNLELIGGPGTLAPLNTESGNIADFYNVGSTSCQTPCTSALTDPDFSGNTTTYPADLVAAGDASLSLNTTGRPDLIGILGSASGQYELNIYTPRFSAFAIEYDSPILTSTTKTPPGASPWGPNWTLETAQPGGHTVLLALDNVNGQLWESTNPAQSASSLVGQPGSTWTQIGGPWSACTSNCWPKLVQADVNSKGQTEVWTVASDGSATPWVITGTSTLALTPEALASAPTQPGHEWPLTDGPVNGTATSPFLADTQTATGNATPTSVTYTDTSNPDFPALGSVATFDGTSSSVSLPAGILQDTTSTHAARQNMTLTMRFKASPGTTGILAGTSTGSLSSKSNSSAPIIYIGTDGRLYAQFPSAHVNSAGALAPDITPLTSPGPVTDGQWHTVTLVADGTNHDQILYLDNDIPIHLPGSGYIDPTTPSTIINPGQTTPTQAYGTDQVTIGAGIFSDAGWVNADRSTGAAGTTRTSYFTGQISDIAFYPQALTQNPAQPETLLAHNNPAAVTSTITSGVSPSLCMDDYLGGTSNGNVVDIYTCNGTGPQTWTFNPDGTITYHPSPGYCLNADDNGTTIGTLIDLYQCNGTSAQNWQILPDAEILDPHAGLCIKDPGGSTTNGTQLQLGDCEGTTDHAWSSPVQPIPAAATATIVSVPTGLCVQNSGATSTNTTGPTGDGNPIQVGNCNGYPAQQWTFEPNGSIVVAGKCLDGNTNESGNPIEIDTCNGGGAQQWAHPDDGTLYNPISKMCLDGHLNVNTEPIWLYTCNYTPDQTWIAPDTYSHAGYP